MLKVWLGNLDENENYVYNTSAYFNINYEPEWINSEFSRSVIRDIDKSEVINDFVIKSPVLGAIPPEKIAGGTKTLILMKFDTDGKIFNASTCGDNCAKWILEIANEKDLTIRLGHLMGFREPFKILILNTGNIVRTMDEFIENAIGIIC